MEHLEGIFNVSTSNFAVHKPEVKSVIDDYKACHSLQSQPKTFQFSKTEDEVILRAISQYKEAYDATDADLCPLWREDGGRCSNAKLWADLADLLVHREKNLIYLRAQRMFREKNGKWSQEQIDEIVNLVEGPQKLSWSAIGRLLGLHREDCQGVYRRHQDRKVTGRFTKLEDDRLVAAVKTVTSCADDLSLPVDGISWKQVAAELNGERMGSDYCKRWRVIRILHQNAALGIGPPSEEEAIVLKNKQLGQLLDYIEESGAEDSSEITWSYVDKQHDWQVGTAGKIWRVEHKKLQRDTSFLDVVEVLQKKRRDEDMRLKITPESEEEEEEGQEPTPKKRKVEFPAAAAASIEGTEEKQQKKAPAKQKGGKGAKTPPSQLYKV
jgi:hypothetical protein